MMDFRLELALRGELQDFSARHRRALAQAVAGAINARGRMLQRGLRAVVARGLGERLAGAVRRRGYPPRGARGEDARAHLGAAVQVYSAARVGVGQPPVRSAPVDLLALAARPLTVTAARRRYLAIPTTAVPRVAGAGIARRRMLPGEYPGGLRMIPTAGGGVLVPRAGGPVLWVLRPMVTRSARIDIRPIVARATRPLGPEILRGYEQRLVRAMRRGAI